MKASTLLINAFMTLLSEVLLVNVYHNVIQKKIPSNYYFRYKLFLVRYIFVCTLKNFVSLFFLPFYYFYFMVTIQQLLVFEEHTHLRFICSMCFELKYFCIHGDNASVSILFYIFSSLRFRILIFFFTHLK